VEQRRQRDAQRRAQELKMVADLCAAPVRVRDIEWVRVDIEGLKQAGVRDQEAQEQARVRRDQVHEGWREAVKARQLATLAAEKFRELAQRERARREAEAERLADLELEEFPLRRPPGLDLEAA
jgi:phage protein D